MNIVLFGPPAAGKGTQSEKLANELNYFKISTGDLLRGEVNKESSLGKKSTTEPRKEQSPGPNTAADLTYPARSSASTSWALVVFEFTRKESGALKTETEPSRYVWLSIKTKREPPTKSEDIRFLNRSKGPSKPRGEEKTLFVKTEKPGRDCLYNKEKKD